MASVVNDASDQGIAAHIRELREEAARSFKLDVRIWVPEQIVIVCYFRAEAHDSKEINIRALPNSQEDNKVMAAIGEILAQDHAQLQHFRLFGLNRRDNGYPQFWRGLAANRILKKVAFQFVRFLHQANVTGFLANPALESLDLQSCTFSDGTFESLCQGIQTSHIKKLRAIVTSLQPRVSWSLLWSALEHGATRLESLILSFSNLLIYGYENGFESFLTNNTTVKSLCLEGCPRVRDGLPLLEALGQGLAVNTTIKCLGLELLSNRENPTIEEQLIQAMFAEGLDQNKTVESLKVAVLGSPEIVSALADGLERMMRNRANAATHGGHDQDESLPVLKELAVRCANQTDEDGSTIGAARDSFFDRLIRSDVIRVEKVKLGLRGRVSLLSSKVYDFIRSTTVTRSLELDPHRDAPHDVEYSDLADAMEANSSILELEVEGVRFDIMTNLLLSPNAYRIRCQCRRNEIQAQAFREDETLSLLPLVLTRLLPSDDTPEDDIECQKIKARQLVDRTISFEILKDMPALFAIYGKRKRED